MTDLMGVRVSIDKDKSITWFSSFAYLAVRSVDVNLTINLTNFLIFSLWCANVERVETKKRTGLKRPSAALLHSNLVYLNLTGAIFSARPQELAG